jgi:peptide/nickel transport system permease protein
MTAWLARRCLASIAIVYAVVTLTFFVIRLAPGDPFQDQGERFVNAQRRAQLDTLFGTDQPILEQYVRYLNAIVHGDLLYSFARRRPVSELLAAAIPNTLLLAGTALVIDFLLGMAIGVFQAMRARSRRDAALAAGTLFLSSVPTFWLGMVLVIVFSQWLHWFPPGDLNDPVHPTFLGALWHLVLPATTLGVVGASTTARYQRAAALDAKAHDYVRTARAKGLAEREVMTHHVLRNALLPTVTLFGMAFPFLLTGAVFIEVVYSWPGMGRLAADAILQRDYPVVSGAMLVASVMVVLGSLIADILAAFVDPRVRAWEAS